MTQPKVYAFGMFWVVLDSRLTRRPRFKCLNINKIILVSHGPVILVAVLIARLFGKPLGVLGGVGIAQRFDGPNDRWNLPTLQVTGAAILCAIGFTVPLIFAANIFGASSSSYAACQFALAAASMLAMVIGASLIARRRATQ